MNELQLLPIVLIYLQKALLGAVTKELRAVTANIEDETTVQVSFFCDGDIPTESLFSWENVIEKLNSWIPPNCALKAHIERLDYPQKIPVSGRYAYLRKEQNLIQEDSIAKTQN